MNRLNLKIKDILYRYVIGKDRRQVQEEARMQGYEQGIADAEKKYGEDKYEYNKVSDSYFVSPNEVFEVNERGILYLGTDQMSDAEIVTMQDEIKYIERSRFWQIIQETLRQKAIEKSLLKSTDWEQVLAGKMMIHSLGIFKSIMTIIKHYKIK
jgi:hypothetical protein